MMLMKEDMERKAGLVEDAHHREYEEWLTREHRYMFYYTAENSICDQYITEKLFKLGYRHFVVPIVLRRAIVEPYVPPHSFIAADDFGSARELALYLRRLAENRAEYLEYFRWRLSYEVITLDGDSHPSTERPFGF